MKKLKQYGYNMANMDDNNSDFSTRKETSNSHIMCFIIIFINNIYINYT